jgi:hypothetical protein
MYVWMNIYACVGLGKAGLNADVRMHVYLCKMIVTRRHPPSCALFDELVRQPRGYTHTGYTQRYTHTMRAKRIRTDIQIHTGIHSDNENQEDTHRHTDTQSQKYIRTHALTLLQAKKRTSQGTCTHTYI